MAKEKDRFVREVAQEDSCLFQHLSLSSQDGVLLTLTDRVPNSQSGRNTAGELNNDVQPVMYTFDDHRIEFHVVKDPFNSDHVHQPDDDKEFFLELGLAKNLSFLPSKGGLNEAGHLSLTPR